MIFIYLLIYLRERSLGVLALYIGIDDRENYSYDVVH